MGTPEHPEGVPHFSNKAMMGKWWKARVAKQKPFHLFFKCTCGECLGEMVVENVLAGVTAVKVECDYEFFRPDILLERGGGQKSVFVEVTHTSGPSQNKLEFCYKEGIDVFELDGSGRPGTRHDTIRNVHVARGNCRKPKRERLLDLWCHMESLEWARVGVKEDFRSPERKQSEIEAQLAHFEEQDALFDSGTLHCARCSKPIGRNKDGSVHHMSVYTIKRTATAVMRTSARSATWRSLKACRSAPRTPSSGGWTKSAQPAVPSSRNRNGRQRNSNLGTQYGCLNRTVRGWCKNHTYTLSLTWSANVRSVGMSC